jgi:CheY-like chemotaxis protein
MTRVLVVDDEIDTLNLLRTILEISGYEAFTTLNSQDALTLAEVERPDLILLDIMMPNLDGFTLCKMMRNHPTTKDLPIVFVTAYSALDLEDRRADAGADMVLPKPIGMDTLIDAVDKATAIRKTGSVPAASETGSSGVIMISLDDKPVVDTPAPANAATVPPAVPALSVLDTQTAQAVKPTGSDDITFSVGGETSKPAEPAQATTSAPAAPPASAVSPAPASPPAESAPATTPVNQPPVSPDKPSGDTAAAAQSPDKPLS